MSSAIAAIGYVLAAAFAGLLWVERSRRRDTLRRWDDFLRYSTIQAAKRERRAREGSDGS